MYCLCCISNELKEQGYSFQTMTWKQFTKICKEEGDQVALDKLGSRWLNNVQVTRKTINHCLSNGWGYRVSSDLFPCLTHPDFKYSIEDVPHYTSIMETLYAIATENTDNLGNQLVRLSCHPDQFNVLASDNEESVTKTIKELNLHGWIMDALGCEQSYKNPINIHINCTKGDPADIALRFVNNLSRCNASVVKRLVVENEDKGIWNVDNLLKYIYKPYKIAITFDNLHHKCNPSSNCFSDDGEDIAMGLCDLTWHGIKPLFHYSESDPTNKNPRAHADTPTDIPPCEFYDWDIELKAKDMAIRMLYLSELIAESQKLGFYSV